jgi:hypothetical protein
MLAWPRAAEAWASRWKRSADPVDHGDVGVAESCRGLGLALETEAAFLVVGQLGWQDLERDVAVQFGVEGFPDDAHAAFADLLDQSVME